ncbi:MAG TPA: AAA family ATPase [Ignavibacteria bacterium]
MANLFFKKITIQNLKCFENQDIDLNVPDGTNEGSGLNILIGENGNGKTTILEAINYITQSTYSSENKLSINDFYDKNKDIIIKAETDDFKCKMPWAENYFDANGIEFKAKNRERKAPGKLLSPPFQISNSFMNKIPHYKNNKGEDSGKDIQSLYKLFSNENIKDGEIHVFLFDKNRTRQINTGTFKTTFDRICEDLNWKFSKEVDATTIDKLVANISGEYFKNIIETAQKGTGEKLAEELSEFFSDDEYKNLKIELVDLLHPFSNAFFALRKDDELKQIKTKDLGSGVEMILTLLLLKSIAGESKGSIIYLIDEPELHLHPRAQDKLLELLLKESKDKQIILSTQSPYIFKNCMMNDVNFIILSRDEDNKILLNYANISGWGKFPWSPSWGEINYHAYGLATIEFHNELYGFIQETTQNFTISDMETYLLQRGIQKNKSWIKISNGNPQPPENATLPTYIRNSIHHPENTTNPKFTETELTNSINSLIQLLPIP